jgi:hypothetical protein
MQIAGGSHHLEGEQRQKKREMEKQCHGGRKKSMIVKNHRSYQVRGYKEGAIKISML